MKAQKETWIVGGIALIAGILIGARSSNGYMNINHSPMNRQAPAQMEVDLNEMDHAAMGHTIQEPGITGQSHMDEMMDQMMAALAGKTGDAFDQAFLAEMIVHHEGAVAMAEAVLETSERKELRELAEAIIAAQAKEIDQMKAWQEDWK